MLNFKKVSYLAVVCLSLGYTSCTGPALTQKTENRSTPARFNSRQDTANSAQLNWRTYFTDPNLIALIDTALINNQELNITLQEIQIARNEVRARKGEYLPFVGMGAAVGADKPGRYTQLGALEATTDIKPGTAFPDPLSDYRVGAFANWEIDVWHKLRNAKKAAFNRYMASVEGKNFMVTQLIAEIANSYYELLALDNQLDIVLQNIELQNSALEIVKLQKQSARVTELAVKRFEAQVLKTKSIQFAIQQQIVETENRLNFLVGRFPQPVTRNASGFNKIVPALISAGIPSQLLLNRTDIRQAEFQLAASKLDVKSAKAHFYPSVGITAGIGFQAFNPSYLLQTPQSMLYSMAGELVGPLINRNAIKANYNSANAKQIQAVYYYEKTILTAFIEVANQLSNIDNLNKSYALKSDQVDALNESVDISNNLFRSARADYMEVLLTQRDALESKFELIETQKQRLNATVTMYRALGGGWN